MSAYPDLLQIGFCFFQHPEEHFSFVLLLCSSNSYSNGGFLFYEIDENAYTNRIETICFLFFENIEPRSDSETRQWSKSQIFKNQFSF
jgi:hypothetical protein